MIQRTPNLRHKTLPLSLNIVPDLPQSHTTFILKEKEHIEFVFPQHFFLNLVVCLYLRSIIPEICL